MTAPPAADDRRRFLKAGLAGLAATMLAPGLLLVELRREAAAAAPAAPGERRWGLLVDLGRCRQGCSACVEACSGEHGWHRTTDGASEPQWIRVVQASDPDTGGRWQLPLFCQHCANPPCADVCPTSATFRRTDGIVLVDRHLCIGCRYCVMACPFGVRFFLGETVTDQRSHTPRGKGTAEACNFCVYRVDNGGLPACVEACAAVTGAMTFGDLNDPNSLIRAALAAKTAARLRPDLALAQGVHYQGL
jgi:molybdopterin-containing oxidoreductase family iron-sulfur binding subunit